MRLSSLIDEYKSWKSFKVTGHTIVRYESALRIFCLCLKDPDIESIEIKQVLKYLQEMTLLGWKRNGLNIVALALRSLFMFAELSGYDVLNAELIPLPRKELNIPRVANEKDFNKLSKAIPNDKYPNNIRNKALIHLVWDTWARSGEILSLDIDDLKFEKNGNGYALIKTEKSRGRRPIREIFWSAETSKYIKKWLKERERLEELFKFNDKNALFISIWNSRYASTRGNRLTNRSVCELFRTISNRAGLKNHMNAHSLRHYGGRKIIKDGGTNMDVSNLLGHSHMDSSYIYTMMWGSDLRDRYNKFRNKVKHK